MIRAHFAHKPCALREAAAHPDCFPLRSYYFRVRAHCDVRWWRALGSREGFA
ncbi:hypothetical protein M9458_056383, partial [Cirrhinus mrigala]